MAAVSYEHGKHKVIPTHPLSGSPIHFQLLHTILLTCHVVHVKYFCYISGLDVMPCTISSDCGRRIDWLIHSFIHPVIVLMFYAVSTVFQRYHSDCCVELALLANFVLLQKLYLVSVLKSFAIKFSFYCITSYFFFFGTGTWFFHFFF